MTIPQITLKSVFTRLKWRIFVLMVARIMKIYRNKAIKKMVMPMVTELQRYWQQQ